MAAKVREAAPSDHANEVRLVGRLAAAPADRELPSGDLLVTFRLVVSRGDRPRQADARTPTVDTIDCAAWTRSGQRVLGRCEPGDLIEVEGALRRRFWRGATGLASRAEVEVSALRRVAKAASA